MSFCHLPPDQLTALFQLRQLEALYQQRKAANKKPTRAMQQMLNRDWQGLQETLAEEADDLGGPAPPSGDAFAAVGNMSRGLQDANLFLAVADLNSSNGGGADLQKALDTHCWDKVAAGIMQAQADAAQNGSQGQTSPGPQLNFDGDDLHQAYAPDDHEACNIPVIPGALIALAKAIETGKTVGNFFHNTMPNFFQHDFANFFTGTLPGIFGSFGGYFKGMADRMKQEFEEIGEELKNLDPTKWVPHISIPTSIDIPGTGFSI